MRISKHVHSCLIVEEKGKVILIDPGIYSHQEQALDLGMIPALDYILITHNHADHMHVPWIQEICQRYPTVEIISNNQVAEDLKKEGLSVNTTGNVDITYLPAVHEKIFASNTVPDNIVFDLFGKLTHPGDSFQLNSTSEVLALPVQAPWGSTTAAVDLALKLQPKVIIPIHDWHWRNEARESFYSMLTDVFQQHEITFKPLETNQTVEV